MPSMEEIETWRGRDVLDRDGDKIGALEEVYLDEQTEQPEFACVKTGLLGRRLTFVPLAEVDASGDGIRVPYEKSQVRDAPSIEPDGHLSPEEEQRLYEHYGLDGGDTSSGSGDGRGDADRAGDGDGEGREDVAGRGDANARTDAGAGAGAVELAGAGAAAGAGASGAEAGVGADERAGSAGGGRGRSRLRRSTGGLAEGIDERIRVRTQSVAREQAERIEELERRVAGLEREIGDASRLDA